MTALSALSRIATERRRGAGSTNMPGPNTRLVGRIIPTSYDKTKTDPTLLDVQVVGGRHDGKVVTIQFAVDAKNEVGIHPIDLLKRSDKFTTDTRAPVGSIVMFQAIAPDKAAGKDKMWEKFFAANKEGIWPARWIEVITRKPQVDTIFVNQPALITTDEVEREGKKVTIHKMRILDTTEATLVKSAEDFESALRKAFVEPRLPARASKRGAMVIFPNEAVPGDFLHVPITSSQKNDDGSWTTLTPDEVVAKAMEEFGPAVSEAVANPDVKVEVIPYITATIGRQRAKKTFDSKRVQLSDFEVAKTDRGRPINGYINFHGAVRLIEKDANGNPLDEPTASVVSLHYAGYPDPRLLGGITTPNVERRKDVALKSLLSRGGGERDLPAEGPTDTVDAEDVAGATAEIDQDPAADVTPQDLDEGLLLSLADDPDLTA